MKSQILINAPLHFPKAKNWMWNYCVYLGPYTDKSNNLHYDLGIHLRPEGDIVGNSLAIVYGNEPGQYISGSIPSPRGWVQSPMYRETLKRAKALNLIKG